MTTKTKKKEVSITVGELIDAADSGALRRLIDLPLAPKHAYHVAKLSRLIDAELKLFNERRNALVKQHGAERKATEEEAARMQEDTTWEVPQEKYRAFIKDVVDLRSSDATLSWGPLPAAALGESAISASDIRALGALIAFEQEDPAKG